MKDPRFRPPRTPEEARIRKDATTVILRMITSPRISKLIGDKTSNLLRRGLMEILCERRSFFTDDELTTYLNHLSKIHAQREALAKTTGR